MHVVLAFLVYTYQYVGQNDWNGGSINKIVRKKYELEKTQFYRDVFIIISKIEPDDYTVEIVKRSSRGKEEKISRGQISGDVSGDGC